MKMGLGGKKLILLPCPREGSSHVMLGQSTRFESGGRRQEQGQILGESLYWGFHGERQGWAEGRVWD